MLPAGDAALLVEVEDPGRAGSDEVLALTAALREAALGGVADLVPAARTVLVIGSGGVDLGELGSAVAAIADRAELRAGVDFEAADDIVIPVRYDGPDLTDVARLSGLSAAEVIARHTGTRWRAAFIGFAPGFAYLTGDGPGLDVPRRAESRTTVPAGSVALAGGFSAVYPTASPGGWQLIGSTDVPLWDIDRDPPSLIGPGQWVRFVDGGSTPRPDPGEVAENADDATGVDAAGIGALEVLRTGPLSVFQDLGRVGLADVGVGRSGAADRSSYLAANRLVGNDDNAAAVECVLGGLSLRAIVDVRVAVTGAAAPITVDGEAARFGVPVNLAAGQMIKLGTPKSGLRTYLSVYGGFDPPRVLGSCSTDTLSGLGPKPLRRGDLLRVGTASGSTNEMPAVESRVPDSGVVTLRAVLGPRDDWFTSAADLAVGEWVVSPNSNRVGLRLDRPQGESLQEAPLLRRKDSRELPSEGLALGSVQVPPSGQPVLFLADHPVTGGYPVIAVVPQDDVDLAAQIRPGQRVRFHVASK